MGQRIADPSLLRLIGRFLKTRVMEEGEIKETSRGTPQGGIISPVLANIYLHYVLDLWFEKEVKRQARKRICPTNPICRRLYRMFEREEDAKGFGEILRQRIGKFGLNGIRGEKQDNRIWAKGVAEVRRAGGKGIYL